MKKNDLYEEAIAEALHDEIDLEERDRLYGQVKSQMANHAWKQKGNEVFCESCRTPHGFMIPAKLWPAKMVAVDEKGMPKFEKLDS